MKRIVSVCAALVVCLSLGAYVLATGSSGASPSPTPSPEATAKTIFDEMQADFDQLTIGQKKQIYKIGDKLTAQYKNLVETYAEFGILSEAEAADLISRLEARNVQGKEEGRMIHGFFPPPHASDMPQPPAQ